MWQPPFGGPRHTGASSIDFARVIRPHQARQIKKNSLRDTPGLTHHTRTAGRVDNKVSRDNIFNQRQRIIIGFIIGYAFGWNHNIITVIIK